jgi:hypothetical protein
MNKEFIPYEQALELKELGFDEKCYRGYDKNQMLFYSEQENGHELNYSVGMNVSAPLYQQAFRWFREKYGLMGIVDCFLYPFSYTYNINDSVNEKIILWSEPENDFDTYEAAELACLKKLIEIVKNK